MKRQLYIAALGLLIFLTPLEGQDIHFSQFYSSPLTLNPAMTGFMQGCYRVGAIHRSQWLGLNHPFVTTSASADIKTLKGRLTGDDFVGVGGMFYNDRSGGGALSENSFMVSGSYHKVLSKVHRIGVGLQTGVVQRTLDYSDLTFPRQLQEDPVNPGQIGSGEAMTDNLTYWDLQAGLLWAGTFSNDVSVFAGGSFYHLGRPPQSFINRDSRLPLRYVVHGGSRIKGKRYLSFTPNVIAMYQANSKELNVGTSVEYNYPNNRLPLTVFSFGSWYRYSDNADALIVVAGVEYRKFKVGASYDVTVSSLQSNTSSTFVGALEFSLSYTIKCKSRRQSSTHPCPRF